MNVRKVVAGLLTAGLLSVPVSALAKGNTDHPQGPPAGTPAEAHEPPAGSDHAVDDNHAAPVRGPSVTGTARAAQASGHIPPADRPGHGPIHAIEVLRGLVASGKLPAHASGVVGTVIARFGARTHN